MLYLTWGLKIKIQNLLPILFILINCYIFFNTTNNIKNSNVNKDYNYRDAYDYIKLQNATDSCFSVGVNYGIIPEIINNYNCSSIKHLDTVFKKYSLIDDKSLKEIYYFINTHKNISYVIIGFTDEKSALINLFKFNKWELKKTFIGNNSFTEVLILKRPTYKKLID